MSAIFDKSIELLLLVVLTKVDDNVVSIDGSDGKDTVPESLNFEPSIIELIIIYT